MIFGRIFGGGSQKPQKESIPTVSNSIRNSILEAVGARAIPAMPSTAQRSFELAINPNAEAHDFVDVIRSDESLSSRIIKIANSVYFDRGTPSNTIEDAVNIIGTNELRCLLNASSLSELLPSKHPCRSQLWANSLATALFAKKISARLLPSFSEVAFLGGLMADIGKLLLLQRQTDLYAKISQEVGTTGESFHHIEERYFPFNHTEVGLLIGEKWHFSPEILVIIRDHHNALSVEGGKNPSLSAIIQAADTIAHALGIGHPKGYIKLQSSYRENVNDVLSALGYDFSEFDSTLKDCLRLYETEYDLYSGQTSK